MGPVLCLVVTAAMGCGAPTRVDTAGESGTAGAPKRDLAVELEGSVPEEMLESNRQAPTRVGESGTPDSGGVTGSSSEEAERPRGSGSGVGAQDSGDHGASPQGDSSPHVGSGQDDSGSAVRVPAAHSDDGDSETGSGVADGVGNDTDPSSPTPAVESTNVGDGVLLDPRVAGRRFLEVDLAKYPLFRSTRLLLDDLDRAEMERHFRARGVDIRSGAGIKPAFLRAYLRFKKLGDETQHAWLELYQDQPTFSAALEALAVIQKTRGAEFVPGYYALLRPLRVSGVDERRAWLDLWKSTYELAKETPGHRYLAAHLLALRAPHFAQDESFDLSEFRFVQSALDDEPEDSALRTLLGTALFFSNLYADRPSEALTLARSRTGAETSSVLEFVGAFMGRQAGSALRRVDERFRGVCEGKAASESCSAYRELARELLSLVGPPVPAPGG